METRDRAYRRYRRYLAIVHKKGVSRRIYGIDWFRVNGKYSKGHIGCGCWMCIWPPSTADEAVFHGQSGPCYAAGGR